MRISDWSSDVCSSDLGASRQAIARRTWPWPPPRSPAVAAFRRRAAARRRRPSACQQAGAGACGRTDRQSRRAYRRFRADGVSAPEIGRASCRASVCPSVSLSFVAVSFITIFFFFFFFFFFLFFFFFFFFF